MFFKVIMNVCQNVGRAEADKSVNGKTFSSASPSYQRDIILFAISLDVI